MKTILELFRHASIKWGSKVITDLPIIFGAHKNLYTAQFSCALTRTFVAYRRCKLQVISSQRDGPKRRRRRNMIIIEVRVYDGGIYNYLYVQTNWNKCPKLSILLAEDVLKTALADYKQQFGDE